MKKQILVAYTLVTVFGLTLFLTDYSFTWNVLDYLTIGIIIVYPVFIFFQFLKPLWLKVTVAAISLVGFCFALYYIVIFVAFYTAGENREIQNWNIDGYKIELTHRQDWAGPAYYRYDLKQNSILNMFEKTLAQSYPGTVLQDTCIVNFKKLYNYGDPVYKFDKCNHTIKILR